MASQKAIETAAKAVLRTHKAWVKTWTTGAPKEVEDAAYEAHWQAIVAYGEATGRKVEGHTIRDR